MHDLALLVACTCAIAAFIHATLATLTDDGVRYALVPRRRIAQIRDGTQEIAAVVRAPYGTVRAPLSQLPCVHWHLFIVERAGDRPTWNPWLGYPWGATACQLVDGTGALDVTAAAHVMGLIPEESEWLDVAPDAVLDVVRSGLGEAAVEDLRRRAVKILEYRLEEGDEVYALVHRARDQDGVRTTIRLSRTSLTQAPRRRFIAWVVVTAASLACALLLVGMYAVCIARAR